MASFLPLDTLKTTRECALKLLEEASEACEALKEHDKVQSVGTYQDALLELADVEQCVCNCLQAMGANSTDWEDAVVEIRKRNIERGRHEVASRRALRVDWRLYDHE